MLIFLLIVMISILIYLLANNVFHSKNVSDEEAHEEVTRLIQEYKNILTDTNEEIHKNDKTIKALRRKLRYQLNK